MRSFLPRDENAAHRKHRRDREHRPGLHYLAGPFDRDQVEGVEEAGEECEEVAGSFGRRVRIADDAGGDRVDEAEGRADRQHPLADAGIVAWQCKYVDNLWRPVTGIREADAQNLNIDHDPTFTPLGAPASNLTGPNFTSRVRRDTSTSRLPLLAVPRRATAVPVACDSAP